MEKQKEKKRELREELDEIYEENARLLRSEELLKEKITALEEQGPRYENTPQQRIDILILSSFMQRGPRSRT